MNEFNADLAARSLVGVRGEPDCWAMGFLTPAGRIITAAHCLPRLPRPDRFADDRVLVLVRDPRHPDRTARVVVESVDPCSDVAVLGVFESESEDGSFHELIQDLEPAPLALDEEGSELDLRVRVRTHLGEWLSGACASFGPAQTLLDIKLDDPSARISEGTSGAPIFDDSGRVLAIVTNTHLGRPGLSGVRLATALPRWVQIDEASACSEFG